MVKKFLLLLSTILLITSCSFSGSSAFLNKLDIKDVPDITLKNKKLSFYLTGPGRIQEVKVLSKKPQNRFDISFSIDREKQNMSNTIYFHYLDEKNHYKVVIFNNPSRVLLYYLNDGKPSIIDRVTYKNELNESYSYNIIVKKGSVAVKRGGNIILEADELLLKKGKSGVGIYGGKNEVAEFIFY